MSKKLLQTSLISLLLFSSNLLASEKVHKPYVEKGEWEIETYGSNQFNSKIDHENLVKTKTGIGYGVTDHYKIELEGIIKKPSGESAEYEATEIVNKFQLFEKGQYFMDFGIYTGYEIATKAENPDEVEVILIAAKSFDKFEHYFNLEFEQEIATNSSNDPSLQFAWQGSYNLNDYLSLGLESHSDFGEIGNNGSYEEQNHRFGPVIISKSKKYNFKSTIGYLAGISDGAYDNSLKWEFEFEF